MKIQKITVLFLLVFSLLSFSLAANLLIADRGSYDVPNNWVYEGVVTDAEGQFPQKKYTYVKNLDECILYGNRDIYEEMKARVPFISKDSFKSTFSDQDLAQIIASASGGETAEVDYGNNHYYETFKVQTVEDGKGGTFEVNSIIDMYFEEEYIHSFSYSYKDKMTGLNDYKVMLASFNPGVSGKQEVHNREYYLKLEREENERKERERKAQEELINAQIMEQNKATTPTPTETPQPTEVPEPTSTPVPTVVPTEEVTASGNNEVNEQSSGEANVQPEENEIEKIEQDVDTVSGENDIIESGNVEGENIVVTQEPIVITPSPTEAPVQVPEVREVRKPIQKKSTLRVILEMPSVQRLIIACVIIDITLTVIVKLRKKKKMQGTKASSENTKENVEQTEEKK